MFDTTGYRFEQLKTELFDWGHGAITNFLGTTYPANLSKDAIENLMDQVFQQMPDDIFEKFYAQYCGECIDDFSGDAKFLSNFYACDIVHDGIRYGSVEAAFQAAKCATVTERIPFTTMTPGQSKRAGRRVPLRQNWNAIRDDVMYQLLLTKFTSNPNLGAMLLLTGNQTLIEGNNWNDHYWGVCDGTGENHLGKLLMRVRSQLSTFQAIPPAWKQ